MTPPMFSSYLEGAGQSHDPLDDMDISAEQEFYLTVLAAFSMAYRSKYPPEPIFEMYQLSVDDLNRFGRQFPEAAQRLQEYLETEAAFIVAFFHAQYWTLVVVRSCCNYMQIPVYHNFASQ
ncbi:hypothetical protein GO988_23510 [Hymenobacter sp. HMF4947]|uniref:Uncharacterized protein n=1 Tax=Hymenobacter ginkgonis TaxID=2682976 RepID=A0A7K1TMG3_9BACT|nr:hypothetical protein [Hymenobacter ginkgonis]MVN79311.1 hypothetical protein [Hymenobacter ginkgonis]